MEFFYILLFLAIVWICTNYYAPVRSRLRKLIPRHIHNWNNYLIILAVLALVLINPFVNFLLGIVAALLYYVLIIRREGVAFGSTANIKEGNKGHLVKISTEVLDDITSADAYSRIRARLFAYIHTSTHTSPSIVSKDGNYDIEIYLTHRRYEDSLLQYMNADGIKSTLKN